MKKSLCLLGVMFASLPSGTAGACNDRNDDSWTRHGQSKKQGHLRHLAQDRVQLGPRPFFLVEDMDDSRLKRKLQQCGSGPFYTTDFSIGHRGAPVQFPEHTEESYRAAARMGAGIVECDVTFTADRQLVCRHSQCDLHATTNILATPLAAKCTEPFAPADPLAGTPAGARCCTSDITLAEFKTLKGKMDASDRDATTVEEYLGGTADWRTDWYAGTDHENARGTLLSHRESIDLFKSLGVKMMPELKPPSVEMPFQGSYTQQDYARQMIDEYRMAGVPPRHVWAQSFKLADVEYWIANRPRFGRQAVFLDASYDRDDFNAFMHDERALHAYMRDLADRGVRIVAPPMWMLLTARDNGPIVPSTYARAARQAGLDIITWTFERSNAGDGGSGDWYYGAALDSGSIEAQINKPGDKYQVLDALAREVGILGIFSDWPGTVTYYANCMGLR